VLSIEIPSAAKADPEKNVLTPRRPNAKALGYQPRLFKANVRRYPRILLVES
jgi:hypothetical protein